MVAIVLFQNCQSNTAKVDTNKESANNTLTMDDHEVTVGEFREFVRATGYQTDAERLGTACVMRNVYEFDLIYGANWQKPDAIHPTTDEMPVTQVSYNDAVAYAKWRGKRLPTLADWWSNVKTTDKGNFDEWSAGRILPARTVPPLGNCWEWCADTLKNEAAITGGSFLCEKSTCRGWEKIVKWLSYDSGNSNLSFRLMK